jgi:hypothetical protein
MQLTDWRSYSCEDPNDHTAYNNPKDRPYSGFVSFDTIGHLFAPVRSNNRQRRSVVYSSPSPTYLSLFFKKVSTQLKPSDLIAQYNLSAINRTSPIIHLIDQVDNRGMTPLDHLVCQFKGLRHCPSAWSSSSSSSSSSTSSTSASSSSTTDFFFSTTFSSPLDPTINWTEVHRSPIFRLLFPYYQHKQQIIGKAMKQVLVETEHGGALPNDLVNIIRSYLW